MGRTKREKDRRTDRTVAAIKEAFRSLIIEKDYQDITVVELARRAGINRKTFYFHYDCMEDVLDDLERETAERILEIYRKNSKEGFDIPAFMRTINDLLQEDFGLYRRLVVAGSYRFLSRNIKDLLKDSDVFRGAFSETFGRHADLIAEFFISGLVKMYKVWFENPGIMTADELSALAARLIWGGVGSLLV